MKNFLLQKRSKNSLKCFRGQILSQTKSRGNQCWNVPETHQPHDLSIAKDNFCSVKMKNPPQHIAPICLLSKVQILNDQGAPLMLSSEFALRDKRHYFLMCFCSIAYLQKRLVSF